MKVEIKEEIDKEEEEMEHIRINGYAQDVRIETGVGDYNAISAN